MTFKTDSGKETLFSERPSCTKIKHFFDTNLLHLKITRADRETSGTPPSLDRLQLELSFPGSRTDSVHRNWGGSQKAGASTQCHSRQGVAVSMCAPRAAEPPSTIWGSRSWLRPPGPENSLWASAMCGPHVGSHHPTPCKCEFILRPVCSLQFLSPSDLLKRCHHFGERYCAQD